MTSIKADVIHTKVAAGVNDPTYEVSKDPWNDGHTITVGNPSDISSAVAEGSSTELVRKDHVHKGLRSIAKNITTPVPLFGNVTLSEGTGISLTQSGQDIEIEVTDPLNIDIINERILNAGVTIEGVTAKDGDLTVDSANGTVIFKKATVEKYNLVAGTNELLIMGPGKSGYRNIRLANIICSYFIGRQTTFYIDTTPTDVGASLFRSYLNSARVEHIRLSGGIMRFYNLPVADPFVVNQIWNDGGTLKISAG